MADHTSTRMHAHARAHGLLSKSSRAQNRRSAAESHERGTRKIGLSRRTSLAAWRKPSILGRMIKNGAAITLAVVTALAFAGCSARAKPPPGYQGVVELEERVVAAEVAGRVMRVTVKRGDVVPRGTPVAFLDDSLARLVRDARAHELEAARAELALLQAGARREDVASLAAQVRAATASESWLAKNATRARALADAGAVPEGELDRVESELTRSVAEQQALEQRLLGLRSGARPQEIARARARVASAEAALALEDERLTRYTPRLSPRPVAAKGSAELGDAGVASRAPDASSGVRVPPETVSSSTAASDAGRGEATELVVLDVHLEPGELAGVGTPLATVAETGVAHVDVFVPQAELEGIHVGATGTLRVDATTDPFPCVVDNVSRNTEFTPRFLFSERERANLVVRVRVRVSDPTHRLHAGVPAFVQIAR